MKGLGMGEFDDDRRDRYEGSERRRNVLSETELSYIADAVSDRATKAFFIEAQQHYNSHQRLDRMLDAYDAATNVLLKGFLALVIVGAILLAGFGASKGV